MRFFLFSSMFFAIVSVGSIQAQSFTDIFDTIFVNISRTQATTGVLVLNHDFHKINKIIKILNPANLKNLNKIVVQTKKI